MEEDWGSYGTEITDENEPLRGRVTDDSVMTLPEEEGLDGIRVTDDSIWTEESPQTFTPEDTFESMGTPVTGNVPVQVSEEEKVRVLTEMTNRGAPKAEIVAYLDSIGQRIHPNSENMVNQYEEMRQRGLPAQLTWTPIDRETVDTGAPIINPNANSFQAALLGAGDSILFGNLDEATAGVNAGLDWLTGENTNFSENYTNRRDMYRAIQRGLEEYNGGAYLSGQVGGMLSPAIVPSLLRGGARRVGLGAADDAATAALGRLEANIASSAPGRVVSSVAASRPAQIVAGGPTRRAMLAGAAYGQGSSTAEDLGGQAIDAGIGATIGGVADRGLRTIGGVIAPRIAPAAQQLRELGANLTPGQMLDFSGIEQMLSRLPGMGSVRVARSESQDSLVRAGYNDALDPYGMRVGDLARTSDEMTTNVGNRMESARSAALDEADQLGARLMGQDPTFTPDLTRIQLDAGMNTIRSLPDGPLKEELIQTFLDTVPQGSTFGPSALQSQRMGLYDSIDDVLPDLADRYPGSEVILRSVADDFDNLGGQLEDFSRTRFPDYYQRLDDVSQAGVRAERVTDAIDIGRARGEPVGPNILNIAQNNTADDYGRAVRGELESLAPSTPGTSQFLDNVNQVYGTRFDGNLNPRGRLSDGIVGGSLRLGALAGLGGIGGEAVGEGGGGYGSAALPAAVYLAGRAAYSPSGRQAIGNYIVNQGPMRTGARELLESLSPGFRQWLQQNPDYDDPQ